MSLDNLNRLSPPAKNAVNRARSRSLTGSDDTRPEHILAALLSVEGSSAARMVEHAGLSLSSVLAKCCPKGSASRDSALADLAAESTQVIQIALDEADAMAHQFVGTEHLLLALTIVPGRARDALGRVGLTEAAIRSTVFGAA